MFFSPWKSTGQLSVHVVSSGGSTCPLFIPVPWLPWFPNHFVRDIYPFWGEGYKHQQAFWVLLSKGYVKGVCTNTPGLLCCSNSMVCGVKNQPDVILASVIQMQSFNIDYTYNKHTCVLDKCHIEVYEHLYIYVYMYMP